MEPDRVRGTKSETGESQSRFLQFRKSPALPVEVPRLGEKDTHMGKADILKLTKSMLTNKAVGE